ncbi:hypothetical protein ATCC90586_008757 [Pythium insidiosum]|nr:hypothetical protein ATCC90586_008757 [Pythium insidiosum]
MCALFYDYVVQVPSNHRQVSCSWGELEPVLAVGLENREVHFFTDEGEKVSNAPIYSRAADVVMTAWQPRGGALAVGWSDGMISLWVYKESTSREVNSPHTARISLLRWAPAGNRLITADENGVLAVWKVDARAQLSLATTYTRQGSLTHCVFATNPEKAAAASVAPSASTNSTTRKAVVTGGGVCPSFFFGGEIGSVHYADDLGHISDIQVLNHAIDSMMFHEEQHRLLVITRALQLIVFQIDATDGTVKPTMKVKLSVAGDGALRETKWAGPGLLAIASGEPLIRFWDLVAEENSVLSLPRATSSTTTHRVNSIDFSPRRRILVAGTAEGAVFFWRCTSVVISNAEGEASTASATGPAAKSKSVTLSHRWDLLFTSNTTHCITRVGWSAAHAALFATTTDGVILYHEANMQRALCGDTAVIQSRPTTLSIERFRDGIITQSSLEASLRIKGVSHDGLSLVLWNGAKAEVFELRDGSEPRRIAQFKCPSTAMALRGDSIYRANGNHVEICNVQGVVKNSISFTEAEGRPMLLSCQNKFLAVATDRGAIRVFDLSRRDPKATGSMGYFSTALEDSENAPAVMMRAIAVNADGTRVCILADKAEGALRMRTPMSRLFLFQADLNIFQQYDFGVNKTPLSVFFDPQEPRLLAVETHKSRPDSLAATAGSSKGGRSPGGNQDGDDMTTLSSSASAPPAATGNRANALSEKEITVMFASNDHGLLMQDTFDLDLKYSALLGIHVPRVYLIAQADRPSDGGGAADATGFSFLRTKIMRDFIGLDKVNEAARQALLDFCYFMTVGNMDEAYRSVKLIDNPSVWENMAHMCVKTKRLDVAEVCLGNMGHARGAAAVQSAKQEPELEVPIAMVAIQLGLRDDAARLYRECGRYDLLNKLYQASGFWQKAVDVAAKRDRIHLKNTHFHRAQHHEALGEIKEAMEAYEDAGTHTKDIPRMLFKLGKLELLQKYISTCKDRALLVWWAQFQESQGHFDLAIESYEHAKDDLSVVRVLCFKKDFAAAAKVVETTRNRAAAYHLARQMEAMEDIPQAIHFYAIGNCYNHTIRLAKEHQLDAELMRYALLSKPSDMLESAAYLESRGEMEKAVQLFHKGGNVTRALELCFSAQLFDELHDLTDELGPSNSSPQLLKRCADFFVENGHYAKAVHLFLVAGRVNEALDVCQQHRVKITEEMAEKMTPPKAEAGDSSDKLGAKRRQELLLKLAKVCKQQGSYHLATKKYTQAGEKIKAMKCLLKSGDTEKVIFFANVSRHNDIYVLAANYLQTLDWRKDPELLKNIVGFYTKARALEQLAAFYQGCALAEIEEFRDYDKALGALQEAIKVLSKAKSDNKERVLQALERRVLLVEQFASTRREVRENPQETVSVVTRLLEEPDVEQALRLGDAYATIAEAYYWDRDFEKSHETMLEMKSKGLAVKSYVDARIVQELHQKLQFSDDFGSGGSDARRATGGGSERKPSPRDAEEDEQDDAPRTQKMRSDDRPTTSHRRDGKEAKAMARDDDDGEMEEDIPEDTD